MTGELEKRDDFKYELADTEFAMDKFIKKLVPAQIDT